MKFFPDEVEFRFKWRPYQARVLSELSNHMDDERLHVVAAPASGKTVLGIEVAKRINGPTLVLAPTLAIRDQWVQRLEELFLPPGSNTPDWVSYDLTRPGFFTVSTYQLLHSVVKKPKSEPIPPSQESEEEDDDTTTQKRKDPALFFVVDDVDEEDTDDDLDEDEQQERKAFDWLNQKRTDYRNSPLPEITTQLTQIGIKTVILDEAHHLRSSWWKSLVDVIRELEDVQILALTATPPYDVPPAEWDRYMALCGPVDAEISVPELVHVKNLCPHQDLVVFSSPSHEEASIINEFRVGVFHLVSDLETNLSFREFLSSHDWVLQPLSHVEEILDEPDFFTSILVYLNHIGEEIPPSALNMVADSISEIPQLSLEFLEVLLTGIFYPRSRKRPKFEPEIEALRDELKKINAIERRKVVLKDPLFIEKILKRSVSKMDSIVDIANVEYGAYGSNLRMVVLSDYIRKRYLPSQKDPEPELNKIGVVPIFESIRRSNLPGAKIGILTGSIIIIPQESESLFRKYALECDITGNDIELEPLPSDGNFLLVKVLSPDKHKMVRVVTDFFSAGGVNILIGTKSLLGEGWDAPSINSLVISSVVGSFMLSNQMRGRAIRIQPGNPNKTANIWHLVCIEPDSANPGPDYRAIIRRFRAFVGISQKEPIIENGFGRLNTGEPPFAKDELWKINEVMYQRAIQRHDISEAWDTALGGDIRSTRLVEDVMFSKNQLPRQIVRSNALLSSILWPLFIFFIVVSEINNGYLSSLLNLVVFLGPDNAILLFMTIIAFICLGPVLITDLKKLPIIWRIFTYPSILAFVYYFGQLSAKRSLRNIGIAVLKSLWLCGEMTTNWEDCSLHVEENKEGYIFCNIRNANRREKSLFLQSLQEVLNPVEDTRYLLCIETTPLIGNKRKDYFAVPKALAIRKKNAQTFQKLWKLHVYPMNLIFTRNPAGRLNLLKARVKSRSALKGQRSMMIARWK